MADETIDGNALRGVSETTLWTLRNRAVEALRPDRVLDDPWAVRLYRAIAYDYDRFGRPGQAHALRALAVDRAVRTYARTHPRATVVALGEGLQTGYWRIADPDLRWVSVDLPPVMELRDRLLPREPAVTAHRGSALDLGWAEGIDPERGVFITAEGLLMYFTEREVLALLEACAERFPGGALIFDSIPGWFRDRTLKGLRLSDRYVAPEMPYSLTVSAAARLAELVPGVRSVRDVMLPPGRGPWRNPLLRALGNAPGVRDLRPSITLLSF